MKTIEKYVCEVCGMEYRTPQDAEVCEKRPIPERTDKVKEGDELQFFIEITDETGFAKTYKEVKAPVIHKMAAFDSRMHEHKQIIYCAVTEDDGLEVERGVILIPDKTEGEVFFSPSEYLYKKGFVEMIKGVK